jgi:hypothetical protein
MSEKSYRKAALLLVAGILAFVALLIWHPDLLGSAATNSTIFETPKGNITLRFDKQGNPTGAVSDEKAQRNEVQIVITFRGGTKKYCTDVCSMDLPVTKIQARFDGKVIATWP